MIPATSWQGVVKRHERGHMQVAWRDPKGVQQFMEQFENKRILVTIEDFSVKRTKSQNAYAYVLYNLIAEEVGNLSYLEIKDMMQRMFLSRPDRKGRMRIRGTSSLTKKEFSDYLERMVCFATAWLGMTIEPAEKFREVWAA